MTKESMRFCGVERSTSHMNLYLELEVSHLQSIGTGKSTSSSVRSLRTISMHLGRVGIAARVSGRIWLG